MKLKWLLRLLFVAFATGFALQTYGTVIGSQPWDEQIALIYAAIAALVASAMVLFEARVQKRIVRELVAVVFGLAAGIVLTCFIFALALAFVLPVEESVSAAFQRIQIALPLIVTAVCYISITVVLQTKDDFRFLLPYIDFADRGQIEGGLLLDSSCIIDGRIVDVLETAIVATPVIVPDFVVKELQRIADSADRLKRNRGRRGLDMVGRIQKVEDCRAYVMDTDVPESCDVDLELVLLAKNMNGRVVTNDFNLNKVAHIEGVKVVNINDLANALKPVVIPGEEISVKVIRPGEEAGQGVGYLDDGTMVVIEQGRDHIDEDVDLIVTGSLQTSAGRMIFGKVKP